MLNNKLVLRGGFGVFYNRLPEQVFDNIRQNPPFTAAISDCCSSSTPNSNGTGGPNDGGLLFYTLGSSKSPASFPANPNCGVGLDPRTGGLLGSSVQIYGAFQNTPTPYVEEWSFGYEYNLGSDWIWDTNYDGSAGHKIDRLVNLNCLYPQVNLSNPLVPGTSYQPFSGGVFSLIPDVNSSYNGLTTSVNRRVSNGMFVTASYRYSKSIDENPWEGPGFVTNETYPQNLKSERGPSDFDATHYLTGAAVYQLPFFRHRNDLVGKALGGWEVNPILTYHSGFPWTPVSGQSVVTAGGPTLSPTRPIAYDCPPNCANTGHSNSSFIVPGGDCPLGPTAYFDISKGGPPGIGRNSFRGPHFRDADLSFAKDTKLPSALRLGEAASLELRANFFNLFNTLDLTPFQFGSSSTHIDEPLYFGRATAGLAGRVVEFQARLSF